MRIAADGEHGADIRALTKPAGECLDLCECAKSFGRDTFHSHYLTLEENKIMAPRRRYLLRQLQEIQRNRQIHLGETTDFKAAYAKQDSGRESLAEEFQRVFFAIHFPGEHKDEVGAARNIGSREPGA